MKCVSILGSTGSIGIQTLDVIRLHPDLFEVCALASGSNVELLEKQVREFAPRVVSCGDYDAASQLKMRLHDYDKPVWIGHSREGLQKTATMSEAEMVVGGLPGSMGLLPTFAAVEAGKDIALATKEVLVMAGRLFMETVRTRAINLLPVDSEQSAIFQCLEGNSDAHLKKILLTASGGPFRDMPLEKMAQVTRTEALDHPRWKMGPKVTVDSATLMNKGLEVIEARWLFDVPASRIEVVIHPQSICHSMVEFTDGSIIAQLGATDMRIPISFALAYPNRIDAGADPISFPELGSLTFMEPDLQKFPLLKAAYDSLESDEHAAPIILNAADEVAVELFLQERIPFDKIPVIVLDALDSIPAPKVQTLAEIVDFHDRVVRQVRTKWSS